MTIITELPSVFEKSIVIPRATLLKMEHDTLTVPVALAGEMGYRQVRLFLHSLDSCDDRYFFSGTSVDEPLGILNSGAAITVSRLRAGEVTSADTMGMMLRLYVGIGSAPAWFVSAGWEGALDPVVALKMRRYPVVYTDSLPEPGQAGDVILADFRYYLIGFNADNPLEFDGLPRIPRPIEQGGYTESPFVILGASQ